MVCSIGRVVSSMPGRCDQAGFHYTIFGCALKQIPPRVGSGLHF